MNIKKTELEVKKYSTIIHQDKHKLNTNESALQIERRLAREFIGEWIYDRHGRIGAGEI